MTLTPEEKRHLLSIVKLYRSWMYGTVKESADELDASGKAFLANRLTLVSSVQKKLELSLGEAGVTSSDENSQGKGGVVIENARVLVADDDAVTAELIATILDDIGFQNVEVVSNGQQALDKIVGDASFDLIICDWRMPQLTGLEVHSQAMEANKLEDTVFILLSAVEDEVLASRAERQGITVYATKPIDADVFEDNIRDFFR